MKTHIITVSPSFSAPPVHERIVTDSERVEDVRRDISDNYRRAHPFAVIGVRAHPEAVAESVRKALSR